MSVNPEVYFKYLEETLLRSPKLDELESSLVICTLHVCVNELLLIKQIVMGFKGIVYSGYTTLGLRTKGKNKIQGREKLSDEVLQSLCIYTNLSYTLDVLEETIAEVNFQGTYGFLQYFLCCENFKSYDEITLKEDYKENTKLLQHIKEKSFSYTLNASNIQKYLLDIAGPCLDRAQTNVWLELKTLEDYKALKENTKIEQNFIQIRKKENELQNSIDKLKNYSEEDIKTHLEVEGHLSLVYTEIVEKIEHWSNLYSTEIDKLDLELLHMRSKSEEQTQLIEKKQEEVKTQGGFLKQLQAESDKRDKEQQQKIKENKAATVIQLWWRNKIFWRKIISYLAIKNKPYLTSNKSTKPNKKQK